MEVAEITIDDLESLKQLQPEGWPDIVPHFKFYINSDFCHPIKFSKENTIVAIGTAILHQSSAWLAHIIVHKDYRNQGLGTKTTQALLDRIDSGKYKSISLIATPLGEPVYRKFGFEKTTDYLFYRNDSFQVLDIDESNIIDYAPLYLDEILNLDKIASGEDRHRLLEKGMTDAKLYCEGDNLLGYYLPALNEGLIVSKDVRAGIELLKQRINKIPIVVIPKENTDAIAFLEENGFKQFQTGSRMLLGKTINFRGDMVFCRIGGNLG